MKPAIFVSTHSRPKAAGAYLRHDEGAYRVSTHSRPKAAGKADGYFKPDLAFQHTAARRRLEEAMAASQRSIIVSTHSRPKAAGGERIRTALSDDGFNTQPPEGGWACDKPSSFFLSLFQHTAARRRLG